MNKNFFYSLIKKIFFPVKYIIKMSEDGIDDQIDYVMAKKLGTYSKMNQELEILGQLSGFTSGPEMDFYTAQKMKKMSYRMMSPSDIFLDSVLKRDKQKFSITDQEFTFLTIAANILPYIQYKNPGGILYAYRYYKFIRDNMGPGKKKSFETDLKNFFVKPAELSVPTFDIFRYYRLLVEYKLVEEIDTNIRLKVDFSKGEEQES